MGNYICNSCRRTFSLDASVWIKTTPYPPGAKPSTAAATYANTSPQVVFDVSTEMPSDAAAGGWIQLTRDACIAAMFSVADLSQEDYPVCQGCWSSRVSWSRSELDAKAAALQSVVAVRKPSSADIAVALLPSAAQQLVDHNVMVASVEEVNLIEAAKRELEGLRNEEAALDAELAALARAEDEVAGRVNDYLAYQFLLGEETDRRIAERHRLIAEANLLSMTTAARELFRIDVNGPVGIVNGLRVGRLPSAQTAPAEINQACGYLLQALQLLVRRHDPGNLNHKLIPNGDTSTIEVLKPKKEVQDFFITQKFFSWKTFGPAWVSFATVLGQVVATLKKDITALEARLAPHRDDPLYKEVCGRVRDVSEFTPLTFAGDKVGGMSVKYGEAADHVWTGGVKNVLIMIRWCFDADDVLADNADPTKAPDPLKPTFPSDDRGFTDLIRRGGNDHPPGSNTDLSGSPIAREADFGEQ